MATSLVEPFSYAPLQPETRQIRLISIWTPDAIDDDDDEKGKKDEENGVEESLPPIRCSLITCSLNSKPRYLALSYVWGTSELTCPLLVDGKVMHITGSLDVVLRHLQAIDELQCHYLWIDAVCINQSDDQEKSWQVQFMKDIYEQAIRVVAWLGSSDEISLAAYRWLRLARGVDLETKDTETQLVDSIARLDDVGLEINDSGASSVQTMFLRGWFRRLWILQECALGRDVDVLCGLDLINWRVMDEASDVIDTYITTWLRKFLLGAATPQELADALGHLSPLLCNSNSFRLRSILQRSSGKGPSIWNVLMMAKQSKLRATNPRDYIYGLFGLIGDGALAMELDYTSTVPKCFTAASTSMIRDGHLRLLLLNKHPKEVPGLPSWVPDWSSEWNWVHDPLFGGAVLDSNFEVPRSSFQAASRVPASVSFRQDDNGHVLSITGIIVDTVEATGTRLASMPEDRMDAVGLHQLLRAQIEDLKALSTRYAASSSSSSSSSSQQQPEDSMLAMVRVLFLDTSLEHWIDSTTQLSRRADRAAKTDTRMRGDLAARYAAALRSPTATTEFDDSSASFALTAKVSRDKGLAPFITTRGRLGIGPAQTRAGDAVVVLGGMAAPVVLRGSREGDGGGSHALVGGAYVHGIMDGEAVADYPDIMLEEFDIC